MIHQAPGQCRGLGPKASGTSFRCQCPQISGILGIRLKRADRGSLRLTLTLFCECSPGQGSPPYWQEILRDQALQIVTRQGLRSPDKGRPGKQRKSLQRVLRKSRVKLGRPESHCQAPRSWEDRGVRAMWRAKFPAEHPQDRTGQDWKPPRSHC